MTIFTFSTKDKRPADEQLVKDIKESCFRRNVNFSGLVIDLLRNYKANTDKAKYE